MNVVVYSGFIEILPSKRSNQKTCVIARDEIELMA